MATNDPSLLPYRSDQRAIGSPSENDRAFSVGAMPEPSDNPIVASIKRLFRYGWGHARFVMGPDGTLVEAATVITAKQLPNEPLDHFMERLPRQYELREGDSVEVVANGGRLDVAKITKLPRC